jgi:hypothetical protein
VEEKEHLAIEHQAKKEDMKKMPHISAWGCVQDVTNVIQNITKLVHGHMLGNEFLFRLTVNDTDLPDTSDSESDLDDDETLAAAMEHRHSYGNNKASGADGGHGDAEDWGWEVGWHDVRDWFFIVITLGVVIIEPDLSSKSKYSLFIPLLEVIHVIYKAVEAVILQAIVIQAVFHAILLNLNTKNILCPLG